MATKKLKLVTLPAHLHSFTATYLVGKEPRDARWDKVGDVVELPEDAADKLLASQPDLLKLTK